MGPTQHAAHMSMTLRIHPLIKHGHGGHALASATPISVASADQSPQRSQSRIDEANGFAAAAGIQQVTKLKLGWLKLRLVPREAAEHAGLVGGPADTLRQGPSALTS